MLIIAHTRIYVNFFHFSLSFLQLSFEYKILKIINIKFNKIIITIIPFAQNNNGMNWYLAFEEPKQECLIEETGDDN